MLGSSCVSVESQIYETEPKSPAKVKDEDNKFRIADDGSECLLAKRTEATLLRKSKKLLISLIDKELQRVQSSPSKAELKPVVNVPVSYDDSKQLKLQCIEKITEELAALKDLEGFYD